MRKLPFTICWCSKLKAIQINLWSQQIFVSYINKLLNKKRKRQERIFEALGTKVWFTLFFLEFSKLILRQALKKFLHKSKLTFNSLIRKWKNNPFSKILTHRIHTCSWKKDPLCMELGWGLWDKKMGTMSSPHSIQDFYGRIVFRLFSEVFFFFIHWIFK